MLLQGIDHVATITNDRDRLKQFYVDVFDATIESDGPEFPGGPRMIIINLGPGTELNVFEIDDNTEADRQTPCSGAAGSTTSGSTLQISGRSPRSARD
jgi:catechol 2,3-dioxygenase-like lactoylglutathione lyase family enzyme